MFKIGTGWLGWPIDTVLHTPIPQILLAFEGKIDFVSKTNPFGSKPKPKPDVQAKIAEQRAIFHRMKLDAWNETQKGAN